MKKVMMDDVVFDSLRRLHLRTIRCYNANICREWHSFEVYVSILDRRYLHRRECGLLISTANVLHDDNYCRRSAEVPL